MPPLMLLLRMFYPGRGPRSLLDAVPYLCFRSHMSNVVACLEWVVGLYGWYGSLGCLVGMVGLDVMSVKVKFIHPSNIHDLLTKM